MSSASHPGALNGTDHRGHGEQNAVAAVVGAGSAAGLFDAVRRRMAGLGRACAEAGRDVVELDKIVLTGFTPEFNPALPGAGARPFDSVDAFVDFAGRHADLCFTELVIHAPVPADGPGFDAAVADEKLFEEIATRGAAQLTG